MGRPIAVIESMTTHVMGGAPAVPDRTRGSQQVTGWFGASFASAPPRVVWLPKMAVILPETAVHFQLSVVH